MNIKRTVSALNKRLSQPQIAQILGVSASTVSKWKRGKIKKLKPEHLYNLQNLWNRAKSRKATKSTKLKIKRFKEFTNIYHIPKWMPSEFHKYTGTVDDILRFYGDPPVDILINALAKFNPNEHITFALRLKVITDDGNIKIISSHYKLLAEFPAEIKRFLQMLYNTHMTDSDTYLIADIEYVEIIAKKWL